MTVYADTSFFVSLYLTDQHSHEAQRKLAPTLALWLTPLHVAEWTHAVEQHVFSRALSRSKAEDLHTRFQQHRQDGLWVEVALPETAIDLSAQLARRYAARFDLRTLDTLHVAVALELDSERFWTFDDRQMKLARATGLETR